MWSLRSDQVSWWLNLLARTLALAVVPFVATLFVSLALVSDHYWRFLFRWEGPIEKATALLLLLSAVFLTRTAYIATSDATVRVFAICAAAASIFMFGEELSWGQQVFDLRAPEYWRAINVQNELNVHNLQRFQRYRHLPLLLVGLAGVGFILLSRYSEGVYRKRWLSELLPPTFLLWTFVVMIVTYILRESYHWQGPGWLRQLAERSEEVGEFALAASACAYSATLLASMRHKYFSHSPVPRP